MTRRRWVALGLVLLAVVGAVVGVVRALDAERIGALAAARAEAALGREVQIARARIQLFPVPAVALEEVTLGGPRPDENFASAADPGPMATVRRVELRPRLLPLLRRQVVIGSLVLDRPSLSVQVDSAGATNLPALQETGGGVEVFELRRLRVRGGLIVYRDARDGSVLRLRGIEQTLHLKDGERIEGMERLRLDGALRVAALDALLPGRLARPVHGIRLAITHNASLDRGADALRIDRLQAQVQDVLLRGVGTVEQLSDGGARTVALQLETGSFDVTRLVSSLPERLRRFPSLGNGQPLAASGQVSLAVRMDGRLGAGATPELDGRLSLDRVSVAQRRNGTLASGLRGEVRFSQHSLASNALAGRVLDQPLQLDFAVRDFGAPRGHLAVRTDLDLARMGRRGLLPEGWTGAGLAGIDARADGPLLEPERLRFSGTVTAAGTRLRNSSWKQPLDLRRVTLELRGQEIHARGTEAAFGSNGLAADLVLRGWLPPLLRESAPVPTLGFDVRAGRFDWDEVFEFEPSEFGYGELFLARLQDTAVRGRTAAEAAEASGLGLPGLPGRIRLDGRVQAATLIRGESEFRDLALDFAGHEGQLELRSARFRIEQPGMRLAARVGAAAAVPAGAATLPLTVEFAVDDPGDGPFVGRFEALRGHLSGSLSLAGTAHVQLDDHLLPVRESLSGEGAFDLVGGRLVNWPLARAIGRQAGIAQFDVLDVRAGTGSFRIAGPWIEFDRWTVDFRDVLVHAAGRFDLAGHLDVRATLDLTERFAGLARGTALATLVSTTAGPDGWIPIGARIGGTAAEPSVRLDLSQARQNVAGNAREAAVDEARERLRQIAQRPRRPPAEPEDTDPPAVPADTLVPAGAPAADSPSAPARAVDVLRTVRRAIQSGVRLGE
jgi:hypothetical protein